MDGKRKDLTRGNPHLEKAVAVARLFSGAAVAVNPTINREDLAYRALAEGIASLARPVGEG